MSRCFPYPPPGYVSNRATEDALIESIQMDREKDRIKQEKKEQQRRKKELKKKDKKEKKKEKERLKSSIQITDGNHKRERNCDGFENSVEKSSFVTLNRGYLQKQIEPEAEQLERSSLTEEYGQPIVTDSLCYSSDGTQSQTKKCKFEQSSTNGNCATQDKVIRFRLKKRESERAHPSDMIPSTSGRTEDPVPKVVEGISMKGVEFVIPRPNEHLALNNLLPLGRQDSDTLVTNSLPPKKVSKTKSGYESLFNEWIPPPIHYDAMEVNNDAENWLFHSKKSTCKDRASLNGYDGLSGLERMSLQPRAHLLPEDLPIQNLCNGNRKNRKKIRVENIIEKAAEMRKSTSR